VGVKGGKEEELKEVMKMCLSVF